ncbi:hypothetical protein DFH07DRAFT_812734 [Mycena maculata]|uniref:Uncharacterized protein n=1 Tax=Mycena maculata TaxID=230809 RepID=A0AAD7JFF9_9AGAR|nr:hypothetical protein DFH07DRAFT_812734 [Mycena maculata]
MACPSGGGPPMNTDISGIGVRVSFYLQTLFLSCLSLRSESLDEITGALYTLLATNTAMAVTALILGFLPTAEISFHDALVVLYLLFLSWVAVCFSMTACVRFSSSESSKYNKITAKITMLHFFSIIQSYTLFAFPLAVLITAETFGSNAKCNPNAVVVLFRPFSALKSGRIVIFVLTGLVVVVYTTILVWDYLPPVKPAIRWVHKQLRKRVPVIEPESSMEFPEVAPEDPPQDEPETVPSRAQHRVPDVPQFSPRPKSPEPVSNIRLIAQQPTSCHVQGYYEVGIPWELIIKIFIVVVVWSLTVMNIELLILWNHFAPSNSRSWQFGQVLPMFLIIVPLVSLFHAFRGPPPRPFKLPV